MMKRCRTNQNIMGIEVTALDSHTEDVKKIMTTYREKSILEKPISFLHLMAFQVGAVFMGELFIHLCVNTLFPDRQKNLKAEGNVFGAITTVLRNLYDPRDDYVSATRFNAKMLLWVSRKGASTLNALFFDVERDFNVALIRRIYEACGCEVAYAAMWCNRGRCTITAFAPTHVYPDMNVRAIITRRLNGAAPPSTALSHTLADDRRLMAWVAIINNRRVLPVRIDFDQLVRTHRDLSSLACTCRAFAAVYSACNKGYFSIGQQGRQNILAPPPLRLGIIGGYLMSEFASAMRDHMTAKTINLHMRYNTLEGNKKELWRRENNQQTQNVELVF